MKLFAKLALAVLVSMLAVNAFAAEKALTVFTDTTLNGQRVAAGDYTLNYKIDGSTAEVKLLKGHKAVVETTGQVVERDKKAANTGVLRDQNADGSSSIVEIQLANQKSVIRFAPETAEKGQ